VRDAERFGHGVLLHVGVCASGARASGAHLSKLLAIVVYWHWLVRPSWD
jgi:hypothetical protein